MLSGMFKKEREFIMDERYVTTVLSAINNHLNRDLTVASCGEDKAGKWFILFDARDKRYERIISDLLDKGNVSYKKEDDTVELVFEGES